MEDLIEEYLFTHKHCPLPAIGTLRVKEGYATAWYSENRISGPVPYIILDPSDTNAGEFVSYIAAQNHISVPDAVSKLNDYCSSLRNLYAANEISLPLAGRFFVDAHGKLVFRQHEFPSEFMPSIQTQRVKHLNVVHSMKVGDTETTSEVMAEYYTEQNNQPKEKWWIWALVFFAIAAAVFSLYYNDSRHSASFGNASPLQQEPVPPTYQTGK